MSVTPPHIEAYLYAGQKGVHAIQISEDGVTFYTLTLTTTALVQDALAEWQSLANGHGTLTGTYAFSWTGSVVRFARTDGAPDNFWLNLPRSVHQPLGFASQAYSGAASYDNDGVSVWIGTPRSIGYDAPKAVEDVLTREHRDGRPLVYVHQHGRTVRLEVWIPTTAAAVVDALGARVRVWPCGASGAYTLANPRGFFDLDIAEVRHVRTVDAGEALMVVELIGTMEAA